VLLVEDDPALLEELRAELARAGYHVDVARTGQEARARTAASDCDAVVLDARIASGDAYAVCPALHDGGVWRPVLMLAGAAGLDERLRAFEAGADSWLGLPLAVPELLARLRALLRRADPAVLDVAGVRLEVVPRTVCRAGREIALSPREFLVLERLMRHAGRPVSRQVLLDHAWAGQAVAPNTVDVYVGYVRRKLRAAGGPELVHTARGAGCVFEAR
jgi:DNA-binding response OmpR family regulator